MSAAAEEIKAAIAKLTAQKDQSTQGPWWAWHPLDGRGGSAVDSPSDDPDNPYLTAEGQRGDVELIVTLHRTIDAQLKLLSGTLSMYEKYAEMGRAEQWMLAVERAGDLDLARAINGVAK